MQIIQLVSAAMKLHLRCVPMAPVTFDHDLEW